MTGWKKGEAMLVLIMHALTFLGSMIAASNIHFDTISGTKARILKIRSHRFPFKSETSLHSPLVCKTTGKIEEVGF
jgi:hypothetical protein